VAYDCSVGAALWPSLNAKKTFSATYPRQSEDQLLIKSGAKVCKKNEKTKDFSLTNVKQLNFYSAFVEF